MYVKYQKHVDSKYDTIFRTVHIEYIYKVTTLQPIIGKKVLRYNFKEEGEKAFYKLKFLLYKNYPNLEIVNHEYLDSLETTFKDNNGMIIASIKLEKELYDKDVIITYKREEYETSANFLDRTMEHAKNASTTSK